MRTPQNSSSPQTQTWEMVDRAVMAFEVAWRGDSPPRIEEYLPPPGPGRLAVLAELVHVDLERHLKQGKTVRVEDYLGRFPELRETPDTAIDLIVDELRFRQKREPGIRADEYLGRFPEYRAELLARLSPSPDGTGDEETTLGRGADEPLPVESPRGDTSIPGYELLEELGRGGMGVVYRARQVGLNRPCAIKMILSGEFAGENELTRFQIEAQVIARLRHPHIVQVFEIGSHQGKPFFSFELCEGGSLDRKLKGTPLPPREAAALVHTLAQAMQAAHEQGIIHRDLKPANVLLAQDGTLKISDFGLAKKLDEAGQTQTGAVMGTPSYMAPEQAHGTRNIGPATDVYALGAILYECLTGRPPFKAAQSYDTLAQVVSQEPVSPRQLNARIPADLETICLRCLEKEPSRRFASAAELEQDLSRFLSGEPIRARPVGVAERAWKWARRKPAIAALMATTALALLALLGVFVRFNAQLISALADANEAREEAERHSQTANTAAAEAKDQRDAARIAEAEATTQRERFFAQYADARRSVYAVQLGLVSNIWESDPGWGKALLADKDRCPDSLRDFTWRYYNRLCQRERFAMKGHPETYCVVFSPDDRTIASSGSDGTVKLWDTGTGQLRRTLRGHQQNVMALAYFPDSKRLATGDRGSIRFWNSEGKALDSLPLPGEVVQSLAFALDGQVLYSLSCSSSGPCRIREWNLLNKQGRILHQGEGTWSSCLALSPDGLLLGACLTNGCKLWEVPSWKERPLPGPAALPHSCLAFSPDNKSLALGHNILTRPFRNVLVVDLKTNQIKPLPPQGRWLGVFTLAYSADSKTLAVGNYDGNLKLWDMATEGRRISLRAHSRIVKSLAFAHHAPTLASGSDDGGLKIWDAAPAREWSSQQGDTDEVCCLAFDRTGKTLALGNRCFRPGDKGAFAMGSRGELTLWDVRTQQRKGTLTEHPGGVTALAFAPEGAMLVSGGIDGSVRLWDPDKQVQHSLLGKHDGAISALVFDPRGKLLATASGWTRVHLPFPDGEIKVWDVAHRQYLFTLQGHQKGITALAFAPDGKTLASASQDGKTVLWDVATRKEMRTLKGRAAQAFALAFAPDGKSLAVGTGDAPDYFPGEVVVWGMEKRNEPKVRFVLRDDTGSVYSLCFSPDGRTLATGSFEGTVKLWDPISGIQRAVLAEHDRWVRGLAFSPDGTRLASGSADGACKVWFAP